MDKYSIPTKLPFSRRSLRVKVVLSYIFDYVIIIVLAGAFYALDAFEPFHQPFSPRNYTLRYPYAVKERVPIPLALALVGLAPAIIIAIYTIVIDGLFSHQAGKKWKKYSFMSRLWELNCGILGLFLSIGASFVITGALKNAIGKPRPDLIDRCKPRQPDFDAFLVPGNYSLVTHGICTQEDNHILKDGFKSFPSGHSSSAFAGLFYLTLYLMGKLHVTDSRGEVWKAFICLAPTLGAALIAGSRIMDARHHPFDVITGSMLGIGTAWVAYRQYFPPLSDYKAKGRAYPIRTWGRISDETETDMVPLRADPSQIGFVSGRESPPRSEGGNIFRDEIGVAQRRRQQQDPSYDTSAPAGAAPVPSASPDPAAAARYGSQTGANPFARSNDRRQFRRDDWDDSTDEDAGTDLELQQTYTISRGPDGQHYDPPPAHLTSQDTSYASYKPQGAPSRPGEGAAGDLGMSSAAPQPPQHRGVQLTETYVGK